MRAMRARDAIILEGVIGSLGGWGGLAGARIGGGCGGRPRLAGASSPESPKSGVALRVDDIFCFPCLD